MSPFKTVVLQQRSTGPGPRDISHVDLLDLGLIPEQWHTLTVAQKAQRISETLHVGPQGQIDLITRLDAANPVRQQVQFRERTVYVPQDHSCIGLIPPAGQAAAPVATRSNAFATVVAVLIVGGLLYATTRMDVT